MSHLDKLIEHKKTTKQEAANDLIEMVREAWGLDSLFCPNYVVTLNFDSNGDWMLRLHLPNCHYFGDETVYTFCFPDDDDAAEIQLDESGLSEEYENLDPESDKAAQMWSEAKNSYFDDADWIADELGEAIKDWEAEQIAPCLRR